MVLYGGRNREEAWVDCWESEREKGEKKAGNEALVQSRIAFFHLALGECLCCGGEMLGVAGHMHPPAPGQSLVQWVLVGDWRPRPRAYRVNQEAMTTTPESLE
jgi:hypothetical protein